MPNPVDNIPNPDTLARAKNGDFSAFNEIVSFYEQPIYRHLYRLTGNRDDALDLSQETFLKLYKNIKKIDLDKSFKAWLYKIATNTAYDFLKSSRKRHEFLMTDELSDKLETFETIDSQPAYLLTDGQKDYDLAGALEQIKPVYRLVIALYYQQGFSYQEIADILDKPLNTVKTYLSRAKAALKNQLEK